MDAKRVDKQGSKILEMCQTFQLRILNGRTDGDRWGRPTRYPACERETPSLLDYALCRLETLKLVETFHVQALTELSDHCCITCKIQTQCEQGTTPLSPTSPPSGTSKGYKFDLKLADAYALNLKDNPRLQELNNELVNIGNTSPTQEVVDELAEVFGNCVVDTARKTFPSKPPKVRKPPKQDKPAKWFNNQCSKLKKAYQRAQKNLFKSPFDQNLKQKALKAYKSYKKACKAAEAKFRETVVEKLLSLSVTDPKEFWRTLKDMREWGRKSPDPSDNIQPETWKEYYGKLLNKGTTKLLKAPVGGSSPELDRPLLLKELLQAIKRAKWGKAAGPDNIQIELLKFAPEEVIKTLFLLMKVVYNNNIFPKPWTVNFLKAIYKKDCKDDPNNYRGLAIAPVICKLYCMILLNRLEEHLIS